jgi:hypothetical protein
MKEDDPDRRMEVSEWFLHVYYERVSFPHFIILADEATFKLNDTVSLQNCVYWATENPCVTEERAVNLPGVSMWYGLSSRGLMGHVSLKQMSPVLPTYQCCGTKIYLPLTVCFWRNNVTLNRMVLHHITTET